MKGLHSLTNYQIEMLRAKGLCFNRNSIILIMGRPAWKKPEKGILKGPYLIIDYLVLIEWSQLTIDIMGRQRPIEFLSPLAHKIIWASSFCSPLQICMIYRMSTFKSEINAWTKVYCESRFPQDLKHDLPLKCSFIHYTFSLLTSAICP